MRIRVVDTETTDLPPNASIVEVGYTDLILKIGTTKQFPNQSDPIQMLDTINIRVKPKHKIAMGAMAIHHIQEEDVAFSPEYESIFPQLIQDVDIFAAHNARFDKQFIKVQNKPWICTMKCARKLIADSPGYSNQVLRYHLKLAPDKQRAEPPHAAGPDTYVTACLLVRLLELASVEQLIDITGKPALLKDVTFGKHKGLTWDKVPRDYLQWLAGQNPDEDVGYTCNYYLGRVK